MARFQDCVGPYCSALQPGALALQTIGMVHWLVVSVVQPGVWAVQLEPPLTDVNSVAMSAAMLASSWTATLSTATLPPLPVGTSVSAFGNQRYPVFEGPLTRTGPPSSTATGGGAAAAAAAATATAAAVESTTTATAIDGAMQRACREVGCCCPKAAAARAGVPCTQSGTRSLQSGAALSAG